MLQTWAVKYIHINLKLNFSIIDGELSAASLNYNSMMTRSNLLALEISCKIAQIKFQFCKFTYKTI